MVSPFLDAKSLNPNLKLFLCIPPLLDWTLCRLCLHPPQKTTVWALGIYNFDLEISGQGHHMYWFPPWGGGYDQNNPNQRATSLVCPPYELFFLWGP